MKTTYYYVRTRSPAGKLLRDHFHTKSLKRAKLYTTMYPDSVIETHVEGEKQIPWTEEGQ